MEESMSHRFSYCTGIQGFWNQVEAYFTDCLRFAQLTPQTDTFDFHNNDMTLFLHKITYYFYSNYKDTIQGNMSFYLLTIF